MMPGINQGRMSSIMRLPNAALIAALAATLSACGAHAWRGTARDAAAEEIYVLRSIRERGTTTADACAAAKTGFEPLPTDAERFYSFWSVSSRPHDGQLVDAKRERVAELRACFGATPERPRQNFYAEIRLGGISFRGSGDCFALRTDFPETGLFSVRCQLVLSDLPAPFVGGLLTTNTITSRDPFGGETDPPGYTQASIATIRLWRARASH